MKRWLAWLWWTLYYVFHPGLRKSQDFCDTMIQLGRTRPPWWPSHPWSGVQYDAEAKCWQVQLGHEEYDYVRWRYLLPTEIGITFGGRIVMLRFQDKNLVLPEEPWILEPWLD